MTKPSRRDFIKGAGLAITSTLLTNKNLAAPLPKKKISEPAIETGYRFFTEEEAAFIRSVVDLILPKDPYGPSATEAGVDYFIDGQLASDYGAGARDYMQGPFGSGEKSQGYQIALPPAKLYRLFIAEINTELLRRRNKPFMELPPSEQHQLLSEWEHGIGEVAGVHTKVFYQQIYANTMEGYYSDPVYGGNRGHKVWDVIGFPGANPVLMEAVGLRNKKYKFVPISIG